MLLIDSLLVRLIDSLSMLLIQVHVKHFICADHSAGDTHRQPVSVTHRQSIGETHRQSVNVTHRQYVCYS